MFFPYYPTSLTTTGFFDELLFPLTPFPFHKFFTNPNIKSYYTTLIERKQQKISFYSAKNLHVHQEMIRSKDILYLRSYQYRPYDLNTLLTKTFAPREENRNILLTNIKINTYHLF